MPAPKAPLLDKAGKSAKSLTLEETVFGIEPKAHLVHETVRAELNAARAGTRGAKSRGLVAGGRSKPWRQKGTGRARAGSIRAPHWTGGGLAFPPMMRSFESKVNRKARRAAMRSASLRAIVRTQGSQPAERRAPWWRHARRSASWAASSASSRLLSTRRASARQYRRRPSQSLLVRGGSIPCDRSRSSQDC